MQITRIHFQFSIMHLSRKRQLSNYSDKKTNRSSHPLNTGSLLDMFVVLPLVLASTILATPVARENMHQYTVYNKCPTPIDLYIGGEKHGTIPKNGNVVKTFSTSPGYFYTDANGGTRNAQQTIHAGFYDVSRIRCVVDFYVDEGLESRIIIT